MVNSSIDIGLSDRVPWSFRESSLSMKARVNAVFSDKWGSKEEV